MIDKLLNKRTIFILLATIVALPSLIISVFDYDYVWWLQGSLFFAITVIIGIYIGQLSTIYKVRHLLETRVDDLVNELAIPKLSNLDNPALESASFEEFGTGLLKLLCEDLNYHAGLIYVFDKSLKPTFKRTYLFPSGRSISMTINDYKLYDDICSKNPNGFITMSHIKNSRLRIKHSNIKDFKDTIDIKPEHYKSTQYYKHIKLLPICLLDEYLGFIALFREEVPSIYDKALDIIKVLSEKSILQTIENKKIDDAAKNFIVRQLMLQVILTLKYLDDVNDEIYNMNTINDLGDKFVRIIRNCWNFNLCLIKDVDGNVNLDADKNIDLHIIKNKLIPKIDLKLNDNSTQQTYGDDASNICSIEDEPGFQDFIAIKIQKGEKYFGYLIATSDRKLTEFEKQTLVILENYKVDDCYLELTQRLKQ